MRNVINSDEVDLFVSRLGELTENTEIRHWLGTVVRRWILNHQDESYMIEMTDAFGTIEAFDFDMLEYVPFIGPEPRWLAPALHRGDSVVAVRLDPALEDDICTAIAWLEQAPFETTAARLSRLSWPNALAAARRWNEAEALRQAIETGAAPGEEVAHRFADGFRVVELMTPAALVREGERMGHCLGAYARELRSGHRFFSLRDTKDEPHFTFETRGPLVLEGRGKQNQPVVGRYRPYVRRFCASADFDVGDDTEGEAGCMFRHAGRTYWNVNDFVRDWAFAFRIEACVHRSSLPLASVLDLRMFDLLAEVDDELTPASRALVVETLLQAFRDGVVFAPAGSIDLYGRLFPVIVAVGPVPIARLVQRGMANGRTIRPVIRSLASRGAGRVLQAVEDHPDCIFLTQPIERSAGGRTVNEDIFAMAQIDARANRHRHHQRLSELMADARHEGRRTVSQRDVSPTCREHWQWQDRFARLALEDDWRYCA